MIYGEPVRGSIIPQIVVKVSLMMGDRLSPFFVAYHMYFPFFVAYPMLIPLIFSTHHLHTWCFSNISGFKIY